MSPSMDPFAQNEALVAPLQIGDPPAAETLLRLNRLLVRKAAHAYLAPAGTLELDDLPHEPALALPRQDQLIISARCGFDAAGPQTLRAIGARCGFTPEGVRQIEKRALRKLRRLLAQDKSRVRTAAGA